MPRFTFDTSVLIAYPRRKLPKDSWMSAVVLQELTAGAKDHSDLQYWEASYKAHVIAETLLVPTAEDWWLAGKVLNSLLRGLKSKASRKIPKLSHEEIQRIIRDVLIARTVKRVGAVLVTDNSKDFRRIKRFCDVQIVAGAKYFNRRA